MPDKITEDCKQKMDSTIGVLQREMSGVRTGRASASLLDSIKIEYYGAETPLSQVATVATPEARTITIQPWDVTQIEAIEKAVMESDIGITPANDGKIIRLVMPMMTEERRKELAKLVKKIGEDNKVAIRNIRRDGMDRTKRLLKDKGISEDQEKGVEAEIQKLTDSFVAKIDSLVHGKEKEILET